MVQVIPVILTFHTYGTGISAGIISDLYRDHICSEDKPYNSIITIVLFEDILKECRGVRKGS